MTVFNTDSRWTGNYLDAGMAEGEGVRRGSAIDAGPPAS